MSLHTTIQQLSVMPYNVTTVCTVHITHTTYMYMYSLTCAPNMSSVSCLLIRAHSLCLPYWIWTSQCKFSIHFTYSTSKKIGTRLSKPHTDHDNDPSAWNNGIYVSMYLCIYHLPHICRTLVPKRRACPEMLHAFHMGHILRLHLHVHVNVDRLLFKVDWTLDYAFLWMSV